MWDEEQIAYHIKAATKLHQIVMAAFSFVANNKQNISEYQVREFIRQRFRANDLISDEQNPIVAFAENTSNIHHFSDHKKSRKLQTGDLIMIDLWGKLSAKNAPFADITWMAINDTKIPAEINKNLDAVFKARDEAVRTIKKSLPTHIPSGRLIDKSAREYLAETDLHTLFTHSAGHPLGIKSVHGNRGGIWPRNNRAIAPNIAYTIEPGIYLSGNYGIRSEINFYISGQNELIITTEPQKEIIYLA